MQKIKINQKNLNNKFCSEGRISNIIEENNSLNDKKKQKSTNHFEYKQFNKLLDYYIIFQMIRCKCIKIIMSQTKFCRNFLEI